MDTKKRPRDSPREQEADPGPQSPPNNGMTNKKLVRGNRKGKLTPFGYIDYDKFYRDIKKDPAFLFVQRMFANKLTRPNSIEE